MQYTIFISFIYIYYIQYLYHLYILYTIFMSFIYYIYTIFISFIYIIYIGDIGLCNANIVDDIFNQFILIFEEQTVDTLQIIILQNIILLLHTYQHLKNNILISIQIYLKKYDNEEIQALLIYILGYIYIIIYIL